MRNTIDTRGFVAETDTTGDSLTINSGIITINGSLIFSSSFTTSSINTQLNPTWIPDPGANRNTNTSALVLFNAGEAISV